MRMLILALCLIAFVVMIYGLFSQSGALDGLAICTVIGVTILIVASRLEKKVKVARGHGG
jgi:hypothetical protein